MSHFQSCIKHSVKNDAYNEAQKTTISSIEEDLNGRGGVILVSEERTNHQGVNRQITSSHSRGFCPPPPPLPI